MRRLLALALILGGCGAPKARRPTVTAPPSAPASVAAADGPALPDPTADTVAMVDPDEPTFSGGQVFPGADDLFTLEENHRNSMAVTGRKERAKHAFWLQRVDGESARRRQVHCSTAKVILEDLKAASARSIDLGADPPVDQGQWLLRVGPGADTSMLLYRHIVKHHRLEYLGRTGAGVALYRYLAPRRVPGEEGR